MTHRPGSLQSKIFWSLALVAVIAAVSPTLFSRSALYKDRIELAQKQALAEASFVRGLLDLNLTGAQINQLFRLAGEGSMRLTIMDSTGRVVRDSHIASESTETLETHENRPEVRQALISGQATSVRYSATLGFEAVYAAMRLDNGGVLRLAVPVEDIQRSLKEEFSSMGVIIAGVIGFCLLLSFLVTNRVRSSLNAMIRTVESISQHKEQRRRLLDVPGKEFLPLAGAINQMADNLEEYAQALANQRKQSEIILESMNEGVLVLDAGGRINRANNALEKQFPGVSNSMGKQLIEIIPVAPLQREVEMILGASGTIEQKAEEGAEPAAPGPVSRPQKTLTGGSAPDDSPTPKASSSGGQAAASAVVQKVHEHKDGKTNAIQFEFPQGRFFVAHLSKPITPNDAIGLVVVFYEATEIMRLGSCMKVLRATDDAFRKPPTA